LVKIHRRDAEHAEATQRKANSLISLSDLLGDDHAVSLASLNMIWLFGGGDKQMDQRSVTHHRWDDIPKEPLSDVLERRLITGIE
jgi:hypothetical protein